MIKKLILPMAAALLGFSACTESNGSASMPSNATESDSLMFYLGQMNAAQYQQMAERDTTLNTAAAKAAYIEGLKAGMNLTKEEDEAFNQGVNQGLQMGKAVIQVQKEYNLTLDKRVYLSAITGTLNSDSTLNLNEVQREFNRIFDKIRERKEEQDKAAAVETLSQEVAGKDYQKISDALYGKVKEKNDSTKITDGDMVNIEIHAKTADGTELNVPFPRMLRVGAPNAPAIITDALLTLRSGEEGEFMTTAHSLLGQRAGQFDLKPTDILCFDLKARIRPMDKKDDADRRPDRRDDRTGKPLTKLHSEKLKKAN